MTTNEILEINIKSKPFILNAPKIKLKKPKMFPTPFSLNDSYINEEENFDSESDNNNSSYEKEINDFQNQS